MAIDYSALTFSKGTPLALTKHRKRVATVARLLEAYSDVDLRDCGFSVISGVYTVPGATDPKRRREHHHLNGRRVRPEWVCCPERIITVTGWEHELLTSNALQIEGCDARERLMFYWNRKIVPPGKEPFRLKKRGA